ncbi:MAG: hypothetical protein NC338_05950 [Firmicutes bacterium]|nr:hypothetical protein [Bacillota bacterium]MCM1400424.1 hypothetical protein [Bacteroides sp.]MCM1477628.1 hypothetical protein [Bacteroides sp.]
MKHTAKKLHQPRKATLNYCHPFEQRDGYRLHPTPVAGSAAVATTFSTSFTCNTRRFLPPLLSGAMAAPEFTSKHGHTDGTPGEPSSWQCEH